MRAYEPHIPTCGFGVFPDVDRSGPDFKERERKAQQIANEIIGVSPVIPAHDVFLYFSSQRRTVPTFARNVPWTTPTKTASANVWITYLIKKSDKKRK